ncbi:hypothetical protein LG943_18235 [Streptomonospora sp. S1-112]|uniref:Uncharacterized protein n=1 Tax=Streptomonospora mangrovi TaxID=2883123 RepID=A0A9X3NSW5_9ACTN|nr:hypothetical protein [Streptomonospora mangrovi]MDA0566240.1 hypothetical protein [Streptomonospora mangrovi]
MKVWVLAGITAGALVPGTAPAWAEAQQIEVSPEAVAPGQSITLTSACEGDARQLEFTSDVFPGTASAELENTFGTVPVVVAPGTPPGVYAVHAECVGGTSTETALGKVTVIRGALTPTPSGAPQTGGGGVPESAGPARAMAAGLLAGLAGAALALGRRAARRGR